IRDGHVTGVQTCALPISSVKPALGPTAVNHSGQLPSVTISFALKPGHSLGTAFDEINNAAKTTLPSTVSSNFQGTAQAFQSSLRSEERRVGKECRTQKSR